MGHTFSSLTSILLGNHRYSGHEYSCLWVLITVNKLSELLDIASQSSTSIPHLLNIPSFPTRILIQTKPHSINSSQNSLLSLDYLNPQSSPSLPEYHPHIPFLSSPHHPHPQPYKHSLLHSPHIHDSSNVRSTIIPSPPDMIVSGTGIRYLLFRVGGRMCSGSATRLGCTFLCVG